MSTERPENDTIRPRRRRPPLAVASVAAAVLLAGGGAAYWASTASGDGGTDAGRAASDGAPPPLALDLADGPSAPSQGIAPGEPDPHGSGVVYRAEGPLPEGPGTAAVHRAQGTVTAAEVTRLAEALGVPGTPRAEGTAWKVGSEGDGSGPFLRVNKQAPGTWTFARHSVGGTDACESPETCSKRATAPSGSPVSEKAAKAAAAPVLKAVGQDGAALDARQVMGSLRVVNADPVVGGLPTYGWSTGVQVGADGEVVGGSGHLKGLEKGDSYPVLAAQDALKQLNEQSARAPKGGIGGCATPEPLEGNTAEGDAPGSDPASPQARCEARGDTPPPTTVTVERATFGLAARTSGGEQILVPSWLFSVRPDGGGPRNTVVQVAVDPEHLAPDPSRPAPEPTHDPEGRGPEVLSYSSDGRTLDVTFWGGVCSTYKASATEDGTRVRVTVTESRQEPGKACIMIAKELTRTVTLDAPLDGRTVVDADTGRTVPRA